MKTLTTVVVYEDIQIEDYGARRLSRFVVSFSSFLSHRNHCTIKWGPSEQSQMTGVMLNQYPMSSSEDNESKSYPKLDESALLVGSFQKNQIGLPPGYK